MLLTRSLGGCCVCCFCHCKPSACSPEFTDLTLGTALPISILCTVDQDGRAVAFNNHLAKIPVSYSAVIMARFGGVNPNITQRTSSRIDRAMGRVAWHIDHLVRPQRNQPTLSVGFCFKQHHPLARQPKVDFG